MRDGARLAAMRLFAQWSICCRPDSVSPARNVWESLAREFKHEAGLDRCTKITSQCSYGICGRENPKPTNEKWADSRTFINTKNYGEREVPDEGSLPYPVFVSKRVVARLMMTDSIVRPGAGIRRIVRCEELAGAARVRRIGSHLLCFYGVDDYSKLTIP